MCGIVGYVGAREAAPILLSGLQRLEYRGYDSAGVAVQNGCGLLVRKTSGRVAQLSSILESAPAHGQSGIGHTRWATHGSPTTRNAHPHVDCSGEIALVHNGVIENADALRTCLVQRGHSFQTDTDSETIAHLIEEAAGATLEQRVATALRQVEGTYGLAVMCARESGKIVVARKGSPVLIGLGQNEAEFFVASDASAVLEHTRSVVYLEDGDFAVISAAGYCVLDQHASVRERSVDQLDWNLEAIELGPYRHFMLKEIFEQPKTLLSTLRGRVSEQDGRARLDGLNLSPDVCRQIRRVVLVGCGTSWHAGLIGRQILETLAQVPVQVEYASQYQHHPQLTGPDTLTVVISQSGETADTLDALRLAKAGGGRVVGIVNVVGSTIAREADGGIYLHAGPEIGVASTKAFSAQVVALLLLGLYLGQQRKLAPESARALVRELLRLPEKLQQTLELSPCLAELAERNAAMDNCLYLGQGINFPVALEGALKLKEISYVHAEGLPAAEMKHGPIALIEQDTPVVFVAPIDEAFPRVLANMHEVRARGGRIIAVRTPHARTLAGIADFEICVPCTPALLSPLLTVVPLQLYAYHMAVLRGCDVDRPRNLAKSVTVT